MSGCWAYLSKLWCDLRVTCVLPPPPRPLRNKRIHLGGVLLPLLRGRRRERGDPSFCPQHVCLSCGNLFDFCYVIHLSTLHTDMSHPNTGTPLIYWLTCFIFGYVPLVLFNKWSQQITLAHVFPSFCLEPLSRVRDTWLKMSDTPTKPSQVT